VTTTPSFPSTTLPSSTPSAFSTTQPTSLPVSTGPTPAFFQPAPAAADADWTDFQAAEKKDEPKAPAKPIDKSDPWARNDLFSFGGKEEKPAPQPTQKKEPMGSLGAKPLSAPMMGAPTANPFGISTPAYPGVMPGQPAGYMTPAGGAYMMPTATPGYGMVAPTAGYPGMPLAAGRGMPLTGAAVPMTGTYGYPSG
jgi:hypothetical protein